MMFRAARAREFQDALMDPGHRKAFDKVVEAWSGELGAMSYAETMKMLDLMLLVATLDNRNEIEELRDTVQRLDRRLDKLVA